MRLWRLLFSSRLASNSFLRSKGWIIHSISFAVKFGNARSSWLPKRISKTEFMIIYNITFIHKTKYRCWDWTTHRIDGRMGAWKESRKNLQECQYVIIYDRISLKLWMSLILKAIELPNLYMRYPSSKYGQTHRWMNNNMKKKERTKKTKEERKKKTKKKQERRGGA